MLAESALLRHLAGLLAALLAGLASPATAAPAHGIAMHGAPDLPPDFPHLPYVNPDAPKGGTVTFAAPGTFDTLNPFSPRGSPAQSVRDYTIESLLARSYAEPFSLYGLIAESVDVPDDRTRAEFRLRSEARFSDGAPVTAADVAFSFELLREHGRPSFRTAYAKVLRVETPDERTVRFVFKDGSDRELPLIMGLMPILPKHATDPEKFEPTGFSPLIGSGPYVVADVRPGERITYRKNPSWWGARLPINRGLYNFDEIRFDYYRDAATMFEAFKRGLVDIRLETDPARWATGYDFPARRSGEVLQETLPAAVPSGMNGLVFNTRRPIFSDVRVREALGMLFDFEWTNRNLLHGLYVRTGSYFDGSELSARGIAADKFERDLLQKFPGAVRPDILEGLWRPPATDGSGRDRLKLRQALDLLAAAGWQLEGGTLRRRGTGAPFAFEILVKTKDQERLALAYARFLHRAGISPDVRLVDAVQFDRRLASYDFDMTQYFWFASPSPGNEQTFYFGSQAADQEGTRNYMGAKNPAADAAIAALLEARDDEVFVSSVRALDRVLLSGFYVVPLFYAPGSWVARWAPFKHPETASMWGFLPEVWWRE